MLSDSLKITIGFLGGAFGGASAVLLPWQFTIIACMLVSVLVLPSLLSEYDAGASKYVGRRS